MTEDTFHLGIKALIQNLQGEILLLRVNPDKLSGDGRDYWDLPGGRVQKGHSVADTLAREVEEEIGVADVINVLPLGMILSNIRIPVGGDSVGLILGVYTCKISENATIKLSDEHTAVEWVAPAEAASRLAVKYPPEFCQLVSKL